MIKLLQDIIETNATRYPAKEAFRFRDESINYGDLYTHAKRLANTLIEQGVRPGDRVGIHMPKCLACATAIFGILQTGAAYVPLDPFAPPQRVVDMIDDCGIVHVVSHENQRRKLRQLVRFDVGLRTVIGVAKSDDLPFDCIAWSALSADQTLPKIPNQTADDLAYIIYTSGSTGKPKGMMHTHASGLAFVEMMAALYRLTADDRLSNFSPLHFDMSLFDFFSSALVGATTTIIPDDIKLMPASLSELVEKERITVWYSVPYALTQMLLRGALETRDWSSLRSILYAGEPFPMQHLRTLHRLLPHVQISNCYGPAEVNVVTFFNMPPLPTDVENVPIGHFCPGMVGMVIDEHDQPVLEGDVGELIVATPTMMQGYWNRPERNATCFYIGVDEHDQPRRYYRTGDLVRLDEEGRYHFLGRKDRQIKSRGYRVELAEVETALQSHAAVAVGAVFPVQDDDGNTLIKAAVILKPDSEIGEIDLRRHVAKQLPNYAVPTKITIMTQFPLTSSGKVDRLALTQICG